MSIVVTRHADQRIKERIPGMKSAGRRAALAQAAWDFGVRLGEGNRVQEEYLRERKAKALIYEEYKGREGVIYRDHMFIFAGDRLITVFPRDEFAVKAERVRAKAHRAGSKKAAA